MFDLFSLTQTFNQACIWDDVIMNKEDALFDFRKKKAEYPIHDLADLLP
jgi:hypothetical protein